MAKRKKQKRAEDVRESLPAGMGSFPQGGMFGLPRIPDFSLSTIPDVDLVDEGDVIRVTVDLPGIRKEDITLNVGRDSITVSANTKREKEAKGKNYYYSERSSSGYYRRIPLPASVNPSTSKARLDSGSLEITVRKEGRGTGRQVKIE